MIIFWSDLRESEAKGGRLWLDRVSFRAGTRPKHRHKRGIFCTVRSIGRKKATMTSDTPMFLRLKYREIRS